jgi:hypothetical protein
MTSDISTEYRAVPLWSWNDRMDAATCEEMVNELARGGYGGAYLHTRLGMQLPFMSNAYLEAIENSVRLAADRGFAAHLYDEDRWPSGWAGGAVPLADPAYRVKALVPCAPRDQPPKDSRLLVASVTGMRYYVVPMPLGHEKFSGTCYADLMNPDAVRSFLQFAYEPLLERLGSAFGRTVPSIFTDEPAIVYLYSWPESGLPWSEGLSKRLERATGKPLAKALDDLFLDRPDSGPTRIQYYRLCAALFEESFMRQISTWCSGQGIRWTGHFMYEHSLPLHFSWAANGHASYRWFDWPGVDHLGRQVGEVVTAIGCRSAVHQFAKPRMMSELYGASGQHLSFADRKWIGEQQLVLGANHLVPHLVSTTLLGPRKRDYPPTISAHQPWWEVNHFVEDHLATLSELMSEGRGEPDLLVIHPQESMYVLSSGPVSLHRAKTWLGRFFHLPESDEIARLDLTWKQLCHQLLDAGYVFDFGDEGVLAEHGEVETLADGVRFRVGESSYRGVLLPPLVTMRPSTLDMLQRLANAGGIVVRLGKLPNRVDGRETQETAAQFAALESSLTGRFATIEELTGGIAKICPPAIEIDAQNDRRGRVWRYSRRTASGRTTLLTNLDRLHERHVKLRWQSGSAKSLTLWRTHEKHSRQLSAEANQLDLALAAGESCCVFEGPPPSLVPKPCKSNSQRQFIDLESLQWHVRCLDENSLLLDQAVFRLDDESWQGPFPVLAIKEHLDEHRYEGPLALRFQFQVDRSANWNPALRLVVEGVERAGTKVSINGELLDTHGCARSRWRDRHWHPVAVPTALLTTTNVIEVTWDRFQCSDLAHQDVTRRYGTDVESLILLGDFSVGAAETAGPQEWQGQLEHHTQTPLKDWLPSQPMRYLAPPFTLGAPWTLKPGDVTAQGLPFYSGRIEYKANFDLPQFTGGETFIRLRSLLAPVATVEVNDRDAGAIAWPPYELDITQSVTAGQNSIRIVLFHSLRNLLGPHHHPVGEPVYATPGTFRPEKWARWLATLSRGAPCPDWLEGYALVQFGLDIGAAARGP